MINRALRRELRRRRAVQDARIYAAGIDQQVESDAYAEWAARNFEAVCSELE